MAARRRESVLAQTAAQGGAKTDHSHRVSQTDWRALTSLYLTNQTPDNYVGEILTPVVECLKAIISHVGAMELELVATTGLCTSSWRRVAPLSVQF